MSDTELEQACRAEVSDTSTWYNWTSELYSFGKCFRYIANFPRFLPLFVTSDHGVGLSVDLFPHEMAGNANIHFTWNSVKELRFKNSSKPKVIRIPHPWILYRRALAISRSLQVRGTLVFFTHHVPGIAWEGHDTEEYFAQLRELPEKFQPVVLCLHMHDIRAGNHKKLRRHGFPMVTVGNTASNDFVDRFYDLVKGFSFACSQDWGSNVAYCVELGIPYFFLGKRPKLINISHTAMQLGEVVPHNDAHAELERRAVNLFSFPVNEITPEQCAFVEEMLGLDSSMTPGDISRLLWREFRAHWLQWPSIMKLNVIGLLRRLGILGKMKKFLRKSDRGE